LRKFGGLDSFTTYLKGGFDPPLDFHMEYVKPLYGKSETASEGLVYSFIL